MRLDLPLQTVIDRRDLYDTPLTVVAEAVIDGTTTVIMGLTADGGYGPEPGDAPTVLQLDSRGWNCPPGSPCTWIGLV